MITVQELIEKLQKFNPDTKVAVSHIYEDEDFPETWKSVYFDFSSADIKENKDLNIIEIFIPEYPNDEFKIK